MPSGTRRYLQSEVDRLIHRFFRDPERTCDLEDGEVVLTEGMPNEKLYYVWSGRLRGFANSEHDEPEAIILAEEGDLIGIKSFFEQRHNSFATVVADGPARVSWVRLEDLRRAESETPEKQLMPLFVHVLNRRQRVIFELMQHEREVQARNAELERASQLGQFAAGVAHELNNALAVIARGSQWLAGALDHQMQRLGRADYRLFRQGLDAGRCLSSREVRQRSRELQQSQRLKSAPARRIAQMGLPADMQQELWPDLLQRDLELSACWELGATFHDVETSAEQAGHVVESMKLLGKEAIQEIDVDLADSLRAALAILRNVTKDIDVELVLPDHPVRLHANKGELVQVWTNLVKNACDALCGANIAAPHVRIELVDAEEQIQVHIADNGPGIPPKVLPKIFQPNFTTKKAGLNFGLGLGLSIVKRIVSTYGGQVQVANAVPGAVFTVTLPMSN